MNETLQNETFFAPDHKINPSSFIQNKNNESNPPQNNITIPLKTNETHLNNKINTINANNTTFNNSSCCHCACHCHQNSKSDVNNKQETDKELDNSGSNSEWEDTITEKRIISKKEKKLSKDNKKIKKERGMRKLKTSIKSKIKKGNNKKKIKNNRYRYSGQNHKLTPPDSENNESSSIEEEEEEEEELKSYTTITASDSESAVSSEIIDHPHEIINNKNGDKLKKTIENSYINSQKKSNNKTLKKQNLNEMGQKKQINNSLTKTVINEINNNVKRSTTSTIKNKNIDEELKIRNLIIKEKEMQEVKFK